MGEAQFFKAWTEGGPEIIKRQMLQRVEEDGWHDARPAITTTVRYAVSLIFREVLSKMAYL